MTGIVLSVSGVASAANLTFSPGDVFIALKTGQVKWYHSDGTLVSTLVTPTAGYGEGMGFDASGNLYLTHKCGDSLCATGNTIDKFSNTGTWLARFGTGYDIPHSIVFDADGYAYVGQADVGAPMLKFNGLGVASGSFAAANENEGTNWIDLDADGCTVFYTSEGPSVKRFNVCASTQLPDFTNSLPGGNGHALQILPSGGVLVANDDLIVRLDMSGAVVQTYDAPGEPSTWNGLALAGDGATFWASNINSGNVYRFDLTTGAVLTSFNAGAPTNGPIVGDVKAVACAHGPNSVTRRGRMTGGGFILTDSGMKVTHGFELHCDPSQKPNNFEVNTHPGGGQGDQFHLDEMTFASCYDDPSINPTPPPAPFDTLHGKGTGTWNGEPGAEAEWTLTDAGEPGSNDQWAMTVTFNGQVVLSFTERKLGGGNHQAHK